MPIKKVFLKSPIVVSSSGEVLGKLNRETVAYNFVIAEEDRATAEYRSRIVEQAIFQSEVEFIHTDAIRYANNALRNLKKGEIPDYSVMRKIVKYIESSSRRVDHSRTEEPPWQFPEAFGMEPDEMSMRTPLPTEPVITSISPSTADEDVENAPAGKGKPYTARLPEDMALTPTHTLYDIARGRAKFPPVYYSRKSGGFLWGDPDPETGQIDEDDVSLPGGYENDCFIVGGNKPSHGCRPGTRKCKPKGQVLKPVRVRGTWDGSIEYGAIKVENMGTSTVKIVIPLTLVMKGKCYNKIYDRSDCCCVFMRTDWDCWTELRFQRNGQRKNCEDRQILKPLVMIVRDWAEWTLERIMELIKSAVGAAGGAAGGAVGGAVGGAFAEPFKKAAEDAGKAILEEAKPLLGNLGTPPATPGP